MDNNRIQGLFAVFIALGISTLGRKKVCTGILYIYLFGEHVDFFLCVFQPNISEFTYYMFMAHLLITCVKVTQLVIVWATLLNRHAERQIFTELTAVDDIITSKLFHWIDFKQARRVLLWNTLPAAIIGSFSLFMYLAISVYSGQNKTEVYMSLVSSLLIRMRYIQYLYMLTLVREKLKILKCVLLENIERRLRIDQLYGMKDVFQKITTICDLINDVFGLSMLFMVITAVSQFVWILHWLVLCLEQTNDIQIQVKISLIIISECIGVTMTCKLGQDCENLSTELLRTLTRMNSQNFECSHCLEDFSLQIMHDPVRFTAKGFFGINFQTFTAMFVMAITQLFVLLQFSEIGPPVIELC